jgi:hypothetical protein
MCCEDELHGDVVASGIVLGRDVGEEACQPQNVQSM